MPPHSHVRFTPESGRVRRKPPCLLWAISGRRAITKTTYLFRNTTVLAHGPTSKPCRTQIGWSPLHRKTRLEMLIRQLTAASLLSLALISFPGLILAAQAATPLALCKADAERICPGVAPGGGKIIACLKQHKEEVSVGCAKALKALKAKRGA